MRGFTLIEILVVLLIVSIMTGIAVFNLPGFATDDEYRNETDRLLRVLELARDESLTQATELGFRPSKNRYQFYRYDEIQQTWHLLDQAPFKERQLRRDIRLELELEGDEFVLNEEDETAPPVMILSSGEMTPFSLTIANDQDVARTLEADGFGAIKWLQDSEE